MLGERAIRAEAPSSRQSRPCRGRAPPCSSPPPLDTSLAAIDGFPRFVRVRRTHWHHCLRRRSHQRHVAPSPSSAPLPVSLSRGTRLSAAEAEAGASLGRAVCLGRWRRVLGHASVVRGPSFLRAGPVAVRFSFLFCLTVFHSFGYRFKNV